MDEFERDLQDKSKAGRYFHLKRVLHQAEKQATEGKGHERHDCGRPFEDQQICQINRWLRGSRVGGPLFQAVKKILETVRLDPQRAILELYGAINYCAAAIILLEEEPEEKE
jgi:hypothetical protein